MLLLDLSVYMSNTGVSYRKQEPFASSWVHPWFFVGSVLPIFLVLCAVLLFVFTFIVLCCDVRYDFHIQTMFGSSLPPVVSRRARVYLRYMCLLCIVMSNTYCVVFFLCLSSFCAPYFAGFSGLSIFDSTFGIICVWLSVILILFSKMIF